MSRASREWRALPGTGLSLYVFMVYIFCMGPALLLASSALPAGHTVGVVLWAGGAFAVGAAAGGAYARLRAEARELRLPGCRPVYLRGYAWFLGILVALPWLLFGYLGGGNGGLPWPVLTAHLGLVAGLLLRDVQNYGRPRATTGEADYRYRVRTASQIIRMYVGAAFAPLRVRSRAFLVRALAVAAWASGLALLFHATTRPWTSLPPVYIYVSGTLCWVWLMNGVARFIAHRSDAFAELALLPGLGDPVSQRGSLYRAVLGLPLLAMFCCLAIGLLWTWSVSNSLAPLLLRTLGSLVLLMFSATVIIQKLVGSRHSASKGQLLIQLATFPFSLGPFLLVSLPSIGMAFVRQPWWNYATAAILSVLVIFMSTMTWFACRSLAGRSHPFLAP